MESLKQPLIEITDMFHKKMASFEDELQKVSNTPSTAESLVTEFAVFKLFVMQALKSLQQQFERLAHNQDQLDMYSRRKILLLHGIPESKNEDCVKVVVDIVKKHLKLTDFSTNSIRRCHRLGRISNTKRHRPLLVKLKEVRIHDEMWFHKTMFKGSGITVSEFLTKMRHDIFMAARQKFGVSKCWTRDGSIFILGPDDVRHKISTLSDLNKIPSTETETRTTVPAKDTANVPVPKTKRAAAKKN